MTRLGMKMNSINTDFPNRKTGLQKYNTKDEIEATCDPLSTES